MEDNSHKSGLNSLTVLSLSRWLFVILLATHQSFAFVNSTQGPQQRLLRHLLTGFDRDGHPAGGASVKVRIGAKVVRIVNIDEKNNVLQAQWWMRQDWNNPDLNWNPADYNGITSVHVDPTKVWVPDVLLYNNADKDVDAAGALEKYKTKIQIYYDGNHTWLAPAMFQSMCEIDIKYFPFDEQDCYLRFASWAYDITKLDVCVNYEDSRKVEGVYQPNNEWDLISVNPERNEVDYACCPNPYSEVVLRLKLSRRSTYYVMNLVFPCALIACMVFFTFVLPPECGERVSLCITVLMAMTIFQELTSNKLPPSSDSFFLIGTYYTVAIFEIGLAIAATCIVLNFHYSKTKMPRWLKSILLNKLAPLVKVKVRTRQLSTADLQQTTDTSQEHDVIHNPTYDSFNLSEGGLGWGGIGGIFEQNQNVALTSINLRKESDVTEEDDREIRKANNPGKVLNGIANKRVASELKKTPSVKETTHESMEPSRQQMLQWQEEWRAAAQVLDRVIIIFSIVIGCTSAAAIFLQAPRVRQMFYIS